MRRREGGGEEGSGVVEVTRCSIRVEDDKNMRKTENEKHPKRKEREERERRGEGRGRGDDALLGDDLEEARRAAEALDELVVLCLRVLVLKLLETITDGIGELREGLEEDAKEGGIGQRLLVVEHHVPNGKQDRLLLVVLQRRRKALIYTK